MAGNTINVQGSYIDVHDNENVYLNVDKANVNVNVNENENAARTKTKDNNNNEMPEALRSEEAEKLMEALVDEGLLDEAWQPVGLSRPQAAMLADRVAEVLGIKNKWKVFEQLWNRKNLRNDYNTAINECAYFDEYRKKLEKIIR